MNNTLWQIIQSYHSVKGKLYGILRWFICPFYLMEQHVPKSGTTIDLGCGEGVFCQYLARKSNQRNVVGYDTDTKRLQIASLASKSLKNIQFKNGDALSVAFSKVNCVCMSDFFHHLNPQRQKKLLQRLSQQMSKGAILLIKEINKNDKVRSILSRFWDFIFYPKDHIYYWSRDQYIKHLRNFGFIVHHRKTALHFPGSTHLFICTKQ